jgi:hypothetical protein
MSTSDKPHNRTVESGGQKPEIINATRRSLSLALAIGALFGPMAFHRDARAEDNCAETTEGGQTNLRYNTGNDTTPKSEAGLRDIRETTNFIPYESDELSDTKIEGKDKTEVDLMNTAMDVLFRHYMQPSFLEDSVDDRDEVEELLKKAITHYDELSYKITPDKYLEITVRKTKKPSKNFPKDFKIIIRDGVITKIHGHNVNLKALHKWKEEWKAVQAEIEESTKKIGAGEKTKENDQLFEFFSMGLPVKFVRALKLKQESFGLNKQEQESLDELERLLKDHPGNIHEWRGVNGKRAQFYVAHRPKGTNNPTPDFMVELVYGKGIKNKEGTVASFQTFATFDFDGSVRSNSDRSKSSPTFGDIYRAKHPKK